MSEPRLVGASEQLFSLLSTIAFSLPYFYPRTSWFPHVVYEVFLAAIYWTPYHNWLENVFTVRTIDTEIYLSSQITMHSNTS